MLGDKEVHFLRTLIVVELVRGIPLKHLIDLHDIGVGFCSLKLIACAIEAEHKPTGTSSRRRVQVVIFYKRHYGVRSRKYDQVSLGEHQTAPILRLHCHLAD